MKASLSSGQPLNLAYSAIPPAMAFPPLASCSIALQAMGRVRFQVTGRPPIFRGSAVPAREIKGSRRPHVTAATTSIALRCSSQNSEKVRLTEGIFPLSDFKQNLHQSPTAFSLKHATLWTDCLPHRPPWRLTSYCCEAAVEIF